MTNIERSIFGCPLLGIPEIEAYYPAPSEERLFLISLQYDRCSLVAGDVKTNHKGEDYIEVIFYNENEFYPVPYKRFVIKKDFMMGDEEEKEFIRLCKEEKLDVDYAEFAYFQESIREYVPDIPIRVYAQHEIGKYLLRIYFSTHRSGAREILYKSSLENVADILSEIEYYNIIGHSPESILGIPKNLIRILSQPELIERIKTEDARNKSLKVYNAFSSYFGKKNLPNCYQWMYLEEIYDSENEKLKFNKVLYRRLKDCDHFYTYKCFIKYMALRKRLGEYNPYKKIPRKHEIVSVVNELERIVDYISDMDYRNLVIKKNNHTYPYENDEFVVITPTTVMEFINEACYQDNCLIGYIDEVMEGKTNIAFIREKKNPSVSFVTMEISGRTICQVKARFNDSPERSVFEFVEKFAREYWLDYDPYYLITCDDDWEILDERDDLREYLADFQDKYIWTEFPDDGIKGEQLCLWDCFPDCFSSEQVDILRRNEEEKRKIELEENFF